MITAKEARAFVEKFRQEEAKAEKQILEKWFKECCEQIVENAKHGLIDCRVSAPVNIDIDKAFEIIVNNDFQAVSLGGKEILIKW